MNHKLKKIPLPRGDSLPLKSKYKLLKGRFKNRVNHKNKVSGSDILNYCYHRWMETRGKSSVEIREMFARAVRSNFQHHQNILPGLLLQNLHHHNQYSNLIPYS